MNEKRRSVLVSGLAMISLCSGPEHTVSGADNEPSEALLANFKDKAAPKKGRAQDRSRDAFRRGGRG